MTTDLQHGCPEWLESFAQLVRDTAPDFTPLYARLKHLEPHAANCTD